MVIQLVGISVGVDKVDATAADGTDKVKRILQRDQCSALLPRLKLVKERRNNGKNEFKRNTRYPHKASQAGMKEATLRYVPLLTELLKALP